MAKVALEKEGAVRVSSMQVRSDLALWEKDYAVAKEDVRRDSGPDG